MTLTRTVDSWLLYGLALTIPTLPFARAELRGYLVSWPFVVILIYSAARFTLIFIRKERVHPRAPLQIALPLLILWAAISSSLSGSFDFRFMIEFSFYLATVVVVASICKPQERTLTRAGAILLIVIGSLVAVSLVRILRGDLVWFEFVLYSARTFGTRNSDAFMIATTMPLALATLLYSSSRLERTLTLLLCGLLTTALVLSLSRGQSLSMALTTAAVLACALRVRRSPRSPAFKSIVLTGVLLCALLGLWWSLNTYFSDTFGLMTTRFAVLKDSDRPELLSSAAHVAADHLIFGVGLNNFPRYSELGMHSHNAYLNMLAELGLPGLILFTVVMFLPLVELRRLFPSISNTASRRQATLYVQAVGIASALVASSVFHVFYNYILFWIMYLWVWLILGSLRSSLGGRARTPLDFVGAARIGDRTEASVA